MYAPTLISAFNSRSSLPCPPTWPSHEDVGPGWHPLATETERLLRSCGPTFDGELRFKNFYGSLWVITTYCSPEVHQAMRRQMPWLRELKSRSRQICEVCGRPGTTTPGDEGWVTTLCPEHRLARQDGAAWEQLMGYRPRNVPSTDRAPGRSSFQDGPRGRPAGATRDAAGYALHALGLRWRSLASDLALLVPEAAEAYRAAADELDDAYAAPIPRSDSP